MSGDQFRKVHLIGGRFDAYTVMVPHGIHNINLAYDEIGPDGTMCREEIYYIEKYGVVYPSGLDTSSVRYVARVPDMSYVSIMDELLKSYCVKGPL